MRSEPGTRLSPAAGQAATAVVPATTAARKTPARGAGRAVGQARCAVVVVLVGLVGTVLLLLQVGSWDNGALACPQCAPQTFHRHLAETLVAVCLPLLATVLGAAAIARNMRATHSRAVLMVAGTAVLLGLAAVAVLTSVTTEPLQRQAAQAERARQPPTGTETAFTPQELEGEMQDLVRASLTAVQSLPGVAGEPRIASPDTAANAVRPGMCRLRNLAVGTHFTFEVTLQPLGQAEQISAMLEQEWLKTGYVRSNPSQGGDTLLDGHGKLPAKYLAVSNDTVSGEPATIRVRMASICVAP